MSACSVRTTVETDDAVISNVGVSGKSSDFRNSHYTNGDSLQDSASFVVNNSDVCLVLHRDVNFVASDSLSYSVTSFGPHTTRALAGAVLGNDNDKFSSAFTLGTRGDLCDGAWNSDKPLRGFAEARPHTQCGPAGGTAAAPGCRRLQASPDLRRQRHPRSTVRFARCAW